MTVLERLRLRRRFRVNRRDVARDEIDHWQETIEARLKRLQEEARVISREERTS